MVDFILEALPNPVIIYDTNWKVNQINRSALDFLGYSHAKEVVGREIYSLFQESDLADINYIQDQIQNQNIWNPKHELHHIHKQGHAVKLLTQFGKMDSTLRKGVIKYVESGMPFGEILDWHNQEFIKLRHYKTLAENVPGLDMILVDKDFNIQCSVGSEMQKHGWAGADPENKTLTEYYDVRVNKVLKPLLKIAFESTPVSREFKIGLHYYSARLIPLIDDEARLSCVVILQNITETKLVEEKLKISKKEAEKANQAKGDFIAKMSHEIRTPLNAITGFTEQLKKTRLTKKQGDYLNVVHNSSQHLLSIIDEILVLSKIDSQQIHMEEVPFRISNVLKAVNDVIELKYREKGLEYKTFYDLSLEEVLVGDPAKLRQILINLVNNAIKFTSKGSVTISCSLMKRTPIDMTVRFKVTDTGIGIADKELANIFKPFHQVDNSIGRNYSGTGLGLTISKDLVERQGGKLTAKSIPGKGSTFSFDLTYNISRDQYLEPEPEPAELPEVSIEKIRLLFVDDDPVNRMLGNVILQDLKASADFAASGKGAIKLFEPGKYDLVLLDINMPGTNGIDVARHIRKTERETGSDRKTKIIAMTANVLKQNVKQYLEAGMDDVILKPFKEEVIHEKIAGVARQKNNTGNHSNPIPPAATETAKNTDDGYDLEQLRRITKGDQEFMLLMLNSFIENSRVLMNKIESELSRENYPEIAEAAHRLIPSMEQLGIHETVKYLKTVEKNYLRKKNYTPDPKLIRKTIEEIEAGIHSINYAKQSIKKQL